MYSRPWEGGGRLPGPGDPGGAGAAQAPPAWGRGRPTDEDVRLSRFI